MYNVLLVDDEPLTTMALSKLIDGSGGPFRVAGTADNGRKALQFLIEHPVDLALVDIRMPMLDGIGLMTEIRKRKLPVRFIVLSAYRDFEYARQALSCGADDYLLKPISRDNLNKALQNIRGRLDRDRQQQQADRAYVLRQQQKAVRQLLREEQPEACDLPRSLTVGGPGSLLLLTCSVELPLPMQEDCMELGWAPCRDLQMLCFLPDGPEADRQARSLAQQTHSLQTRYFLPALTISRSASGLRLPDAFHQCLAAADFRFYRPQEELLEYSRLQSALEASVQPVLTAYETLSEDLRLHREDQLLSDLQDLRRDLHRRQNIRSHTLYQLGYDVLQQLRGLGYEGRFSLEQLHQFDTLDSLADYLEAQCRDFFAGTARPEVAPDDELVERAKAFCRANYARDCSLEDVAAAVYVSKNYLSQIFRDRCGTTIWNYFTEIRMKKARELLSGTEIKVNQVGEMVGYPNASHFCHVFRSRVGLSPKDYRLRSRQIKSDAEA